MYKENIYNIAIISYINNNHNNNHSSLKYIYKFSFTKYNL